MINESNKQTEETIEQVKSEPIFIHSLWRTGSTYLFLAFRRSSEGYWCYQEPIHEFALYSKNNPKELLKYKGETLHALLRHPNIDSEYFFELFEAWDSWKDVITKPIIYDQYFDLSCSNDLRNYINALLEHSKGRPVFQECRTSGRIKALKDTFAGVHLYLWRNPWDQWWSFKVTDYFDVVCQLIINAPIHPEIISRLRKEIKFNEFHNDDLSQEYAYFDRNRLPAEDSYLAFYLIWCVGLLEGIACSSLLINIDSLSESKQYQQEMADTLLSLGVPGLYFSDCSVYQNHFTAKEAIFFERIEDRVHGLLLASGYSQQQIDELLAQRVFHEPKQRLMPINEINPLALLTDAGRAREVAIRYESAYSARQKHAQMLWENECKEAQFVEGEIIRLELDAASREKAELLRLHGERELILRQEYATREKALKEELDNLLHSVARREQEFSEKLLAVQHSFEYEKTELLNSHTEQEKALHKYFVQREDALRQEQNMHLQTLQQQFADTLVYHKHQHELFRQLSSAFEEHLKHQVQTEQQAVIQLKQTQAELESKIDAIHTSFIWWITAPLRKLLDLFRTTEPIVECNSPILDYTLDSPVHIPVEPSNHNFESMQNQVPTESACIATRVIQESVPVAKTVDELLSFNDEQFVRCAYQTLLGRVPDPGGLGYYLGRLRTGISKIQILAQLRLSKEGKVYSSVLPELDFVVNKHHRGKYPLIGWLFR